MEIFLLISFIVFFSVGFYFGRKRNKKKSSLENCSHSYAQGLNYLLANESDKAIQLFVDLIEVDGETAETHLALGKLFRSKGEVDKSIKIHLNILAKPSLTDAQKVQVLFELASDYLKAGLLDRAENVFKELLELDNTHIATLRHLQNIYIAEKSWLEAIAFAEILIKLKEEGSKDILTHCYCELAELKIKTKEYHLAKQYLELAIETRFKCVRAFMLRLTIEIEERDFKRAEKTLTLLMENHLDLIDLFIEQAYTLYKQQDRLTLYAVFLQKYNQKFQNSTINLAVLRYYFEVSDLGNSHQLLDNIIQSNADLDVYEIALRYLNIEQFGAKKYEYLRDYLKNYNKKMRHYSCKQCGYESHTMQWHCPSCNTWSSIAMKQESNID